MEKLRTNSLGQWSIEETDDNLQKADDKLPFKHIIQASDAEDHYPAKKIKRDLTLSVTGAAKKWGKYWDKNPMRPAEPKIHPDQEALYDIQRSGNRPFDARHLANANLTPSNEYKIQQETNNSLGYGVAQIDALQTLPQVFEHLDSKDEEINKKQFPKYQSGDRIIASHSGDFTDKYHPYNTDPTAFQAARVEQEKKIHNLMTKQGYKLIDRVDDDDGATARHYRRGQDMNVDTEESKPFEYRYEDPDIKN